MRAPATNARVIQEHSFIVRSLLYVFSTALFSLACTPLLASDLAYDTSRVVAYNGNECDDVPDCQSVATDPFLLIEPDQTRSFSLHCPETHPYAWHWDAAHHEHILTNLVGHTFDSRTFSAQNLADVPGNARFFIGCSTEPFDIGDSGYMIGQGGLPTGQLK